MKITPNSIRKRCGCYLRRLVTLKYRLMGVRIEGRPWISAKAYIDTSIRDRITIRHGCIIAAGSVLLAHDQASLWLRPRREDDGTGYILLEDHVFVGARAIILRNVTVGRFSVVAAGAVVTQDVPPFSVVGGVPARVIGRVPLRDAKGRWLTPAEREEASRNSTEEPMLAEMLRRSECNPPIVE